jgi:hypothetical protein
MSESVLESCLTPWRHENAFANKIRFVHSPENVRSRRSLTDIGNFSVREINLIVKSGKREYASVRRIDPTPRMTERVTRANRRAARREIAFHDLGFTMRQDGGDFTTCLSDKLSWCDPSSNGISADRRAIKRACVKTKIGEWAPNQLRHTAATEIRR